MSSPVRLERREHTMVLIVDRPSTKNAVDPDVHARLSAALDHVAAGVRAIVITGAGGMFVSGGDLKLIRDRPTEETLRLSQDMTALLDRFEALSVPVIAAIEGGALGGGVEIALACDYRVAARGAVLSFRQAAMGLTTGWGATTRLSRIVPRGVATRLLMTAETLDAEHAHALGLVDELADHALERAIELAEQVARVSPRAIAGLKRTLAAAYAGSAAREVEWDVFRSLWGAGDHREALEAFFAKRAPRWP